MGPIHLAPRVGALPCTLLIRLAQRTTGTSRQTLEESWTHHNVIVYGPTGLQSTTSPFFLQLLVLYQDKPPSSYYLPTFSMGSMNGVGYDEIRGRLGALHSAERPAKEYSSGLLRLANPFAAITSTIIFFHGTWRDALVVEHQASSQACLGQQQIGLKLPGYLGYFFLHND